MNIKAILLRNAVASGFGKASVTLFRLIQVPLLLAALGVDDFGRWLVLSTLPSWLTLANLGFGSVGANEISMAVAAGDLQRARSVYSTTLSLVVRIGLAGSVASAIASQFVPWARILSVPGSRTGEMSAAATWLAISVLISFPGEVFGGRFRAAHKAHVAMFLGSLRPWLDLSAVLLVLRYSSRFDHLALAQLGSTILFLAGQQWLSRRCLPDLTYRGADVDGSRYPNLFRLGFAFQAFPLGNALLFQGTLLVVQVLLGPAAVALFGTARTLVRSVNQLMDMVNQVMWPELSHLLGVRDLHRAARLHRAGVGVSLLAAVAASLALAVVGRWFYGWWTGKSIELPQHLLVLFLISIPFNALWSASSVTHMASNQHEGLAVRYMIGTTAAVLGCGLLSWAFGLEGAAVSTLVADLVLIPFVLKRSLRLTGDSWSGFVSGMINEVRNAPRLWRAASPSVPGSR